MKSKLTIVLALLLCISVFLSGCNVLGMLLPKKPGVNSDTSSTAASSQKSGTASSKATGSMPSGTITGSGGTAQFGDNVPWPSDAMGNIPKPNANLTVVTKDANSKTCGVYFDSMSEGDANTYFDTLKGLGYKGFEGKDTESITLIGTDSAGNSITFVYNIGDGDGGIIYAAKS